MFDKGSSVVPSLDRKVVHSLNVPFIKDISYQKRVVAILSNLDRKIALNRAINQNLRARREQRESLLSLCRAEVVNGDVSRNLESTLDHSLGVAGVRRAA